jgi:hypothetical protein
MKLGRAIGRRLASYCAPLPGASLADRGAKGVSRSKLIELASSDFIAHAEDAILGVGGVDNLPTAAC